MKQSSDHIKGYAKLGIEIINTAGNTTAYMIRETQGAEFGDEAEKVRHLFEMSLIGLTFSTGEVLDKHFKGELVRHFHQSDAHKEIEGDPYLRYKRHRGSNNVEIWIGGDNGEVCALITDDPVKLSNFLRSVL